ncbi:MAG: YheC/YheD family protein [Peptococcaceae bacterium]
MSSSQKLLIGIMVKNPQPLFPYEFAPSLGIDLFVFSPQGINWRQKKIKGLVLENNEWKNKTCPFPLAVYNRLYLKKKKLVTKLEKVIGKNKVFNAVTKFDKWEINTILQKSNVADYLPATFIYTESSLYELLEKYQFLIFKPSVSCLGRQVYLVEHSADHHYLLYHNLNLPKIKTTDKTELVNKLTELISQEPFIVQQFIPPDQIDGKIYDIRIYVQKNSYGQWTASGKFSRVGFCNSYISNYCQQLKSINDILQADNLLTKATLEKMESISIKTARAIEREIGHLGEISVDFLLDRQGKPWIIEANGKTQKSIVNQVNDETLALTIYRRPIEYALFLARKSK